MYMLYKCEKHIQKYLFMSFTIVKYYTQVFILQYLI